MSKRVRIGISYASASTGILWDESHAVEHIHSFIPQDRRQGPVVGILDIGESRLTPIVLDRAVLAIAEDAKVGRYGSFSLFVISKDEDTRNIIGDLAMSRNVAVFVGTSLGDLGDAEPKGLLTTNDCHTLEIVAKSGGTVTAVEFADSVAIENNAAGNRLSSLHKKGYLQRVARPSSIWGPLH